MNAKLHLIALTTAAIVGNTLIATAGSVSIKGSNTFGEEFGPIVIKAFEAEYAGVPVSLESTSSGDGIRALLDRTCDIASASRAMNEDELRLAKSRGIRVQHHGIGFYSVAVIAHPDNRVSSLSDQDVRDLFTGRATNWRDVSGADKPVDLVIRDPSSGTHLGFRELAMGNEPYAANATAVASYADMVRTVASNPHAIGYADPRLAGSDGVKIIAINQFKPSGVAVAEGLYPYVRMLRLYTRMKDTSPDARKFVRFIQSSAGQHVVESFGYMPIQVTAPSAAMPSQ